MPKYAWILCTNYVILTLWPPFIFMAGIHEGYVHSKWEQVIQKLHTSIRKETLV